MLFKTFLCVKRKSNTYFCLKEKSMVKNILKNLSIPVKWIHSKIIIEKNVGYVEMLFPCMTTLSTYIIMRKRENNSRLQYCSLYEEKYFSGFPVFTKANIMQVLMCLAVPLCEVLGLTFSFLKLLSYSMIFFSQRYPLALNCLWNTEWIFWHLIYTHEIFLFLW